MAPAVNLSFFQSNEVKRDEQAHSLWQAPDSQGSKESGTKHFLRITKNAWIVAQFQCESTFIPHIADCDYAQRQGSFSGTNQIAGEFVGLRNTLRQILISLRIRQLAAK
jgi:hypothetical protein